MESDCCGAYSSCSDDIDICPYCGEHADWNDCEDEDYPCDIVNEF